MPYFSRAGLLKRGVLLFWPCWISIVVFMNIGDALKACGLLPDQWKLASGNYEAIVRVTGDFGTPPWFDMVMFMGILAWEALCTALLWRAFSRYRRGTADRWRAVYLAFSALLGLFGLFILGDELFHAYKMEGDHRGIAALLLVSLLALHVLPDRLPET
jgi:hypothetical protein